MDLIIVSGLSGAGKSVALHTLEDIGYYCIDNLPLFLLRELALGLKRSSGGPPGDSIGTAVGIDARTQPEHLADLPGLMAELQQHDIRCRVLFLTADGETLMQRFSETRRKHPLTRDDRSLEEAIRDERDLLAPLRDVAESRIDTTHTNVHELRDLVRERLSNARSARASVLLQSFGFKHGVPEGVDFVFDVRCLPNPHWQAALRPLTGRDEPVIAFLDKSAETAQMRADLSGFLDRWIPRFETDGRSYLTIAIGCTGGQHRSVYMVESLRQHLAEGGHRVLVRHRELA
ncbi:RNase adapter RapZ [Thiohalocapsa marina]|uniref:RNase adapter RapZ n=1 Tax=Thiohalocapsa marina TaxID=424902 RepID=A0A5M8FNI1_9GAMM|nr:RNase adapter RapZ [Thiohalocapsa marina]KAA6186034.1 RNase adapter RapZ [Thiohalocapsa marina]